MVENQKGKILSEVVKAAKRLSSVPPEKAILLEAAQKETQYSEAAGIERTLYHPAY